MRPLVALFVLPSLLAGAAFCAGLALAQTPADARTGEFFLVDDGGRQQQAVHLESQVTMDISGMTNRVVLRQSFTNDTGSWQEGIYVFPLPEDSAVNAMKMLLEEREIIGDIRERAEARRVYEQARSEGRRAALTEQQRPNLFTQRVANIAPGETISIELQYIQALHYEDGRFSLRFPMTLTPRYIPGAPLSALPVTGSFRSSGQGWASATTAVPDAAEITPPYHANTAHNMLSMTIRLDAGLPLANVASPTHELVTTPLPGPGPLQLQFRDGAVRMDRDFELQWTPDAGSAPQAAAFVDAREDGTYVQLMLLPPRIEDSVTRLGREFIIVLDTSGSMEGNSIVQAKQSVEIALRRLRDDDWFNIVEFNSGYQPLYPASVPATPANIEAARRFVQSLQAEGGTEMLPALRFALTAPPANRAGESQLKQIVFITDGSVGNEQQLFALIRTELRDARLFTVGIGSAPNSYFMREAAESGRGTYVHIQDSAQVTQRMNTLLHKLENAAMTDLSISWPTGMSVEHYPSVIPDLYLGEPLFVTARASGSIPARANIRIAGAIAGRNWERTLVVDMTDTGGSTAGQPVTRSSLASYWARQKVEGLLDAALSQGSQDEAARAQMRNAVLAVALPYQLLSPYTSFVAVENRISRPANVPSGSHAVGNTPPAGQTLAEQMANQLTQQVVYPATATPADLLVASGVVALVFALLLRWPRRREEKHARHW